MKWRDPKVELPKHRKEICVCHLMNGVRAICVYRDTESIFDDPWARMTDDTTYTNEQIADWCYLCEAKELEADEESHS